VADLAFHPEAQAEYDAALAWYQARSLRAAARFEADVERTLTAVQANPQAFPAYDDEHRYAVLRRYPYSVVYLEQPDRILVIAVAHAGRAAGYWQGRA
jgi:toxin ParE1/3/4